MALTLLENSYLTSIKDIHALQHQNALATIQRLSKIDAYKDKLIGIDQNNWKNDWFKVQQMKALDVEATQKQDEARTAGPVLRSGGTSSLRKVIHHSWRFNDQVTHLGVRSFQAITNKTNFRIANCYSSGDMLGAYFFAESIARELRLPYYPIGSSVPLEETLNIISDHKIDILMATPSYAQSLYHHASIRNQKEKLSSISIILYLGEMFPKTFYEKICSLHPNVCIHNLSYTTTETGPIGYQCTSLPNDCFHIHEDAIWVEVIEPITKQPIMDVPGNIIVTPFSSTGIPLLRYDTGDKGILRSVSCQCGHKTRVIQLLGRSQQSIKICGAIIQKSYIIDSIRSICKEALVNETNIQVQQIQNHDGIQVKILLNKKNWTCISARRIEDRLRQDHHFSFIVSHPACRLFGVSSVPFTEFAMTKSGKTPFFITIHEKQ